MMLDLEMKKEAGSSVGDRVLILLLSLNFVLLAFFILMNGMATSENHHATAVLAKMREGYDIQGPQLGSTGTAPKVAMSNWQQVTARKIQGLVVNRLHLDTVPLQVDADRLVMVFPEGALVDGGRVVQPEVIRNILAAAGTDASVRWEISGELVNATTMAANAGALMAATGQVAMVPGTGGVRVVFIPGATTKPSTGATLQHLTIDAGANDVRGEGDGR